MRLGGGTAKPVGLGTGHLPSDALRHAGLTEIGAGMHSGRDQAEEVARSHRHAHDQVQLGPDRLPEQSHTPGQAVQHLPQAGKRVDEEQAPARLAEEGRCRRQVGGPAAGTASRARLQHTPPADTENVERRASGNACDIGFAAERTADLTGAICAAHLSFRNQGVLTLGGGLLVYGVFAGLVCC